MNFQREWAMPSPNTLSIPPIRAFALRHLAGHVVIVDPFAKDNRFGTLRNDLDPDTAAEYHLEAEAFAALLLAQGVKASAAIVDPPYSPRQMSECYKKVGMEVGMRGTQNAGLYSRIRDALMPILTADALVLSFGWNSAGMGKGRGFELIEQLNVCHGGAHNDTLCIAERRVENPQADLSL